MFGNTISNSQISALVKKNELVIAPFDTERLTTAHYCLSPLRLFDEDAREIICDFLNEPVATLKPGVYYKLEVDTLIVVPKGIVGVFTTSSTLIEMGISLHAGRIDWPYGQHGEPIRFGLKNETTREKALQRDTRVAHVEFRDLRGLELLPFDVSPSDLRAWLVRKWRAADDGPSYE